MGYSTFCVALVHIGQLIRLVRNLLALTGFTVSHRRYSTTVKELISQTCGARLTGTTIKTILARYGSNPSEHLSRACLLIGKPLATLC